MANAPEQTKGAARCAPTSASYLDGDDFVFDQPVERLVDRFERSVARLVVDQSAGFVDAGVGAVRDMLPGGGGILLWFMLTFRAAKENLLS